MDRIKGLQAALHSPLLQACASLLWLKAERHVATGIHKIAQGIPLCILGILLPPHIIHEGEKGYEVWEGWWAVPDPRCG